VPGKVSAAAAREEPAKVALAALQKALRKAVPEEAALAEAQPRGAAPEAARRAGQGRAEAEARPRAAAPRAAPKVERAKAARAKEEARR